MREQHTALSDRSFFSAGLDVNLLAFEAAELWLRPPWSADVIDRSACLPFERRAFRADYGLRQIIAALAPPFPQISEAMQLQQAQLRKLVEKFVRQFGSVNHRKTDNVSVLTGKSAPLPAECEPLIACCKSINRLLLSRELPDDSCMGNCAAVALTAVTHGPDGIHRSEHASLTDFLGNLQEACALLEDVASDFDTRTIRLMKRSLDSMPTSDPDDSDAIKSDEAQKEGDAKFTIDRQRLGRASFRTILDKFLPGAPSGDGKCLGPFQSWVSPDFAVMRRHGYSRFATFEPLHREILRCLLARHPNFCPEDHLTIAWNHFDLGDPKDAMIEHEMSILRFDLARLGLTLEKISTAGWRLTLQGALTGWDVSP